MDIEFGNDDLVKIKANLQLESNIDLISQIDCWFRVMFKDNNGTFVGRLEKYDNFYSNYNILMEDQILPNEAVRQVYMGEEFCCNDNVTTCDCKGLCRNKSFVYMK